LYGDVFTPKTDADQDSDLDEIKQEASCILFPYNMNKWSLYISILLIYTALAVPIKVGFAEIDGIEMILFDTFVDCSFLADLVL
jgi:hypothetical protein